MTQAAAAPAPAEPAAAAPVPAEPATERRTRPLGVVLLVIFQVLNATSGLLVLAGVAAAREGTLAELGVAGATPVLVVLAAIGILQLVAAIQLWRLRKSGWYAAMLLTGLGLAVQIGLYILSNANFFNLAIFVVSAFYLNQHAVKSIFLAPRGREQSVILAVEEDDRR